MNKFTLLVLPMLVYAASVATTATAQTSEVCKVLLALPGETLVEPYAGDCAKGLAEGTGRYKSKQVSESGPNKGQETTIVVEGQFRAGQLSGKGTMTIQSPPGVVSLLEGEFVKFNLHGRGTSTSRSATQESRTVGEWQSGRPWNTETMARELPGGGRVSIVLQNGRQAMVCSTDAKDNTGNCTPEGRALLLSQNRIDAFASAQANLTERLAKAGIEAPQPSAVAAAGQAPSGQVPAGVASQPAGDGLRMIDLGGFRSSTINSYNILLSLGVSQRSSNVSFWSFITSSTPGDFQPRIAHLCAGDDRGAAVVAIMVPSDVNVGDDRAARALMAEGEHTYRQRCGANRKVVVIHIIPQDFKVPTDTERLQRKLETRFEPVLATGAASGCDGSDCTSFNLGGSSGKIPYFANYVKQDLDAKQRLAAFIKTHGVQEWPNATSMKANPFAYEGKVVGTIANFRQMISASSARVGDYVYTDVPRNLFTTPRQVMIAGRVTGNTELKEGPGTVLLPSLKFTGAHFCEQPGCAELTYRLR